MIEKIFINMKKTYKCINIENFLEILNETEVNEYQRMNIDILDENDNNISKYIITNLPNIQYIKFYEENLREADIFLYNKHILQVDNKFVNKYFYNIETLNYDEDMIILKTENYDLLSKIDKFEIISVNNDTTIDLNKEEDKNNLIKYISKKSNKKIEDIINLTDETYQERNNKIIINNNKYLIEKTFDTLSTLQLIVSNNNLLILNKKNKKFN